MSIDPPHGPDQPDQPDQPTPPPYQQPGLYQPPEGVAYPPPQPPYQPPPSFPPLGAGYFPPPPPAPPKRKWWKIVVPVVALVLAGAGVGAYAASGGFSHTAPADAVINTKSATVDFVLYDSATAGAGCDGAASADGYDDVTQGMPFLIKDGKGEVVGNASLDGDGTDAGDGSCEWKMKVVDLPVRPQYTVNLGDRGAVGFSKSELQSTGWVFEVKLGNPGQ